MDCLERILLKKINKDSAIKGECIVKKIRIILITTVVCFSYVIHPMDKDPQQLGNEKPSKKIIVQRVGQDKVPNIDLSKAEYQRARDANSLRHTAQESPKEQVINKAKQHSRNSPEKK